MAEVVAHGAGEMCLVGEAEVERAAKELVQLGATRPEFQPGGDEWAVLADPEGHLFCLAAAG